MSILKLEEVTYRYPAAPTEVPALTDVSVSVEPGEFVVLAGVSGAGKSTLLRLASGLAPHFHGGEVGGRILVGGLDTREHRPADVARVAGTVLQDPETQVVMGTVRAELAFPLENRGESAAAVARGVEEAALALGIAHLLDRPTGELSGGELQRVALAAALGGRPRLLLLDEPTSQLDPVAGDELIAILQRLREDYDTAVVLSEHRLERVLPMADRAVALAKGRVAFDGNPDAFLAWALREAPALSTPGAKLLDGLGLPPSAGVRAARAALRGKALAPDVAGLGTQSVSPDAPRRVPAAERPAALRLRGVWHEMREGPAILRGVNLAIGERERVALMGRNGAGKSTLLRHAAALMKPTRGRIDRAGRVALLLQNPGHYLVHDTVAEEASHGARALVGLDDPSLGPRNPRDLSGGERQRLALAVVLGTGQGDEPPAVVCLDEPTRGMDRAAKEELAGLLSELPAAVLVATHDAEFVAAFAGRVVLLADGAPISDGPPSEILGRGTYFATETARILEGALRPQDALERLSPQRQEVTV